MLVLTVSPTSYAMRHRPFHDRGACDFVGDILVRIILLYTSHTSSRTITFKECSTHEYCTHVTLSLLLSQIMKTKLQSAKPMADLCRQPIQRLSRHFSLLNPSAKYRPLPNLPP